ncbi:MAG: hypothetical protein M1819_006869 [Sarea resinae]|nr:MAG: hypothetical protein M1819_006869 [Sarea resinae]
MPQNTAIPAPLPPSVENAYRSKCIELRRRMNEVDEANDAFRLRKLRLNRGIRKMRLERAFLLAQLARRTRKSAVLEGEESSGSEGAPPPTPKDKPLRAKRNHRRPSQPLDLPSPPPPPTTTLSLAPKPSTVDSSPPPLTSKGASNGGTPSAMTSSSKPAPSTSELRRAHKLFVSTSREVLQARADTSALDAVALDELVERCWSAVGLKGQLPWIKISSVGPSKRDNTAVKRHAERDLRGCENEIEEEISGTAGGAGEGEDGGEGEETADAQGGKAEVEDEDVRMDEGGEDGDGDGDGGEDGNGGGKGKADDGDGKGGIGGGFTAVNR